MKTKNFIALPLIALTFSVSAQLPQNIKDSFKSKYPNITIKNFRHSQNKYVVIFKNDDVKYSAAFSEKGEWIETMTNKSWKKIPATVKKALQSSKYGDWQKYKGFQVETPAGTLYAVDVLMERDEGDGPPDNIEYYVYFTPSGDFVKQVKRY